MATYEVTLRYPDRRYDDHSRFLAAVARSPRSNLLGFSRAGPGLAVTVQVVADRPELVQALARQAARSFWPNYRPAEAS